MSDVSIIRCASYDEANLSSSLDEALKLIGGIESFVKPSQKVLLKVNCLMAAEIDSATTTHPLFVKAVAKKVLSAGAVPMIGDNPGNAGADPLKVLEQNGYGKIARELGIELVNFQQSGTVTLPARSNKIIRTINVSKAVLDADVIINLPKLKTHMMVLYTGAVKNMFGAVPGFNKSRLHFTAPNPDDFASILVDIYSQTKPSLNIMDAVMAMEGNGPSGGKPRKTDLIIASADGVALDCVASSIIGYDPLEIPTTKLAMDLGLGEGNIDKIDILGIALKDAKVKDFIKVRNAYELSKKVPRMILKLLKSVMDLVSVRPSIDRNKCTACQTCVKNCPAGCMTVEKGKTYKIDRKKCIMCFCCHELCPYKAIELKKSLLAKAFIR